ncbi:MAG: response regulator [Succinivibrio sp.]|nr:response regulator [Succinivibrio sp.]
MDIQLNPAQTLIVAVDDDPIILFLLKEIFEGRAELDTYNSGDEAMRGMIMNGRVPDLILLDYLMPGQNGVEVLKELRNHPLLNEVPVVLLTGDLDTKLEAEVLSAGANDFIRKPFVPQVVLMRVEMLLKYRKLRNHLESEVREQTRLAEGRREQIERIFEQMLLALTKTIDAKDLYTRGHSQRVAQYSRLLAALDGCDKQRQQEIYYMGMLHDIGKIGIPDTIITKPDKLTDEEFAKVKSHPQIGGGILDMITDFPELGVGARWHHERYDGKGYPDGLKGEQIPAPARLIAVADTYDALTSRRSYRDILPQSVVRAELQKGSGTQFDPHYAELMLKLIDADKNYTMHEQLPEEEEKADNGLAAAQAGALDHA